jgi:hypothetical protein
MRPKEMVPINAAIAAPKSRGQHTYSRFRECLRRTPEARRDAVVFSAMPVVETGDDAATFVAQLSAQVLLNRARQPFAIGSGAGDHRQSRHDGFRRAGVWQNGSLNLSAMAGLGPSCVVQACTKARVICQAIGFQ